MQPLLRLLHLFIQRRKLFLLLRKRSLDQGLVVAEVVDESLLGDAVEVSKHPVIFSLRDGVVLVVVTAGASHGQAQPYDCRGVHAVGDILYAELFRHDSALGAGAVIAVEARGDFLAERGARQQVAGDLLDREPIERHVAIERVDNPVAPAPHVAITVRLVAVGVGVTRGFHPAVGHAFGVAR